MKHAVIKCRHKFFWHAILVLMVLSLSSQLKAQQEIPFNGERSFHNGLRWMDDQNNTSDQLDGFTNIRLSSNNVTLARAEYIASLNKTLMVGLAWGDMLSTYSDWPGTVLADSNTAGPLYEFKQGLNNWSNAGIEISDIFYNHEVSYDSLMAHNPSKSSWTPKAVSGLCADLIHAYKRALRAKYPQARLWVYAGTHEAGFTEYVNYCTDWEAITTGPDRPDIGACTAWIAAVEPHYSYYLEQTKNDIRDTHALMNGVPYTAIFSTRATLPSDPDGLNTGSDTYVRNTYQNNWETFKTFVREIKATVDSINSLNSPGFNSPTQWYQYHYFDEVGLQHPYTLDSSPGSNTYNDPPVSFNGFSVPFRDFPYRDYPYAQSKDYPARLWESGAENWDWSRSINQWEAEIIANYLKGVEYDVPGHQITSSRTWSGEIILTGDVEITSGATLTIQAGTKIYLRPQTDVYESGQNNQKIEIIVAGGNLIANGTLNDPIIFSSSLALPYLSLNNFPYGTANKGDWVGIRQESGSLTLNNCIINHVSIGVEVSGGSNLALLNTTNGVGTGGENRGNLSLDPKYFNSVDELNNDSPLIDAGKPDPTMSDPSDNTRINIGRYGGTTLAKASAAGGGQKLFFDDFTGGTSKWNFEQGSWTQTNNRLERTANDGGVITINTSGAMNWTDYSLEFQVNGRDGGALVRAQDVDNGVALIVRPNGNDVYWHVKQNGDWGPQYNKETVTGLQGKTLLVKVTAVGDVYTAYINGVVVTSLTNSTFSSGKVGLYSGGGTEFTWYDDVSVTSLGGTSGGGQPTVLLDEHFDYAHGTEPAPGWIDDGDAGQVHWKVKNNEYVLESSNQNVNRAYRDMDITEYVVETKIRFDASEGKVIYSHADQHELYRLDLMADSDRFRLMINDQPTTLNTTVNRNQWYDVKIEAKSGNYVKVWIDNTLIHDVSTTLSFDGWMGVGSYNHNNDGVQFDDFKVSTLATGGGGSGGGGTTPFANGDFESGNLTGWSVSGSSNPWAINNTWPLHNPQYGSQIGLEGNYCAGTNEQEWYTGTMTSGDFTINQAYLNFRIGGHNGPNNTDGYNKVELRRASDHAVLLTEYTPGTNDLMQKSWHVSNWNNESVYIACIDNHSGGGHAWISVDDFKLAGVAAKPTVMPLVVAKTVDVLPDTFTVAQNVPNPFNPETVIAYTLPTESDVSLKIYNALGQEVRVLVQNMVSAGRHQVQWNGRDAVGQLVSSGIYFYRFQAGPLDETRKMLILK
jgi:hypothetical protein